MQPLSYDKDSFGDIPIGSGKQILALYHRNCYVE